MSAMSPIPGRIALANEQTVEALARAVPPRFSALVLLLRYTGLRWAEAVALKRKRCYVREGTIEVAEVAIETPSCVKFRTLRHDGYVSVRDGVKEALAQHLARYVGEERNAVVFTEEWGEALVLRRFHERVWWPALASVGLPREDHDVQTLASARLWSWQREVAAQRVALRSGCTTEGGGWNVP